MTGAGTPVRASAAGLGAVPDVAAGITESSALCSAELHLAQNLHCRRLEARGYTTRRGSVELPPP